MASRYRKNSILRHDSPTEVMLSGWGAQPGLEGCAAPCERRGSPAPAHLAGACAGRASIAASCAPLIMQPSPTGQSLDATLGPRCRNSVRDARPYPQTRRVFHQRSRATWTSSHTPTTLIRVPDKRAATYRARAASSCALFIVERPARPRCCASLRSCSTVRPPGPLWERKPID